MSVVQLIARSQAVDADRPTTAACPGLPSLLWSRSSLDRSQADDDAVGPATATCPDGGPPCETSSRLARAQADVDADEPTTAACPGSASLTETRLPSRRSSDLMSLQPSTSAEAITLSQQVVATSASCRDTAALPSTLARLDGDRSSKLSLFMNASEGPTTPK